MTIIEQIINGDLDADLDGISDALRERKKLKKSKTSALNMATIAVGDIVVLRNLKPKYVNGLRAKVVGKKRTKLEVELERPVGRFSGIVTVPVSCLDKV